MSLTTLIAFYSNHEEAVTARRGVADRGCRRLALVHKGLDGTLRKTDPLNWRRVAETALVAFICAQVAGLAVMLARSLAPPPGPVLPLPLPAILLLAAAGGLTLQLLLRHFRHRVDPAALRDHARRLLPGETLLVLQAPVESLALPMTFLRGASDTPPALFVMHPRCERRGTPRIPVEKLSPAQIQEHARRHAKEQEVERRPGNGAELLKRLRRSRHWVRQVCADLGAASCLEQKATPAADWILDNEYLLEGNVRDVLLNLPGSFYRQLPTLASDPYQGHPCIYGLAKDLVSHSELHLDRESVLSFIESYQSVRNLSIAELWAVPQMLRIALIESIQSLAVTALADLRERQLAEFWANRLVAANRRDANQLFATLAELAGAEPSPTPYFAAQLVGLLYDEAAALAPVQNWLERTLQSPLYEFNSREQNRQTREQISCGNAFTSLRQLSLLDWREIFEKLSRVEGILRRDPSGVYPTLDFATRDRCRRAVEDLAHGGAGSEVEVAGRVLELALASRREAAGDDRFSHVGAWLEAEGRAELVRQLSGGEAPRYRVLAFIHRHHTPLYALGIGGLSCTLLLLSALYALPPSFRGAAPLLRLGLIFLTLIPASQLAVEVVNYLVTRFLPPRPLAKMDFEASGIPDAYRTLVVVPMLLVNEATLQGEVEKLEIRYLANKEDNLFFSLFTDYTDASSATRQDDTRLLASAVAALDELNLRHPGGRFFLFHRERTWSDSEQKFIGWERKRGKLEELNGLIDGTRPEGAAGLVHVGDPDRLADVRFVITLDSDTHLPHGTARRLIETLAHPLNLPRFDQEGNIAGGYTIIQPRVSPTLTSTSASTFSRLFADAVGIDPYTQAVSDVYHDLSGEGSYHGKGIYDVRAFSRILSGRFPEEWVLSHDLIEGAHVRVGLASDIELYDEFPHGYQSYSSRAHRWIRGDWQIAGWVFPSVPHALGGRSANRLSFLNRWKILDNLRRSLLPAASLALLIASWFISPRAGALASLAIGMQLLFHPLAQPFTMATTRKGIRYFAPGKLCHDLLRAVADAALLPHQAAVALDAIARVAYRRLVSGRDLLEWTAQASHRSGSRRQRLFVAGIALSSVFSVAAGGALWCFRPASLPQALPWLVLWFCSPGLGWLLNLHPEKEASQRALPEQDRRFLREVARRTWRYFSVFVGPDTSWLPPDNFQRAHQNRVALRTSPTNIGLWMTSALGAHDMGYLTLNQLLERLTGTMASIGRLELFRGHLLNWYDIGTLAPLEPRYVSGVDSGNLLGALVALEQGLGELAHGELLGKRTFDGLHDTGTILKQVIGQERLGGFDRDHLDQLLDLWGAPPDRVVDALILLRKMEASFRVPLVPSGAASWAGEMEAQVAAWIDNSQRYLAWIEILAEKEPLEVAPLGPEFLAALGKDLSRAPSLAEIAGGEIDAIRVLAALRHLPAAEGALAPWIDRVIASFGDARWLAGETLGALERLMEQVRELAAGMRMEFLYDPKQKLFAIGYNVSSGRLDLSSYDLLASEARLGSFVAIARGDVPMEHWFSLGRPYGAIGRQRVLLSWTGTMFEYLMPLLFQHSFVNSLLDKAAREAVAVQIAYASRLGVPWGISESAFADLDLEKTYQYKAFGVPALGLKRAVDEKLVVAPYATLLALSLAPRATLENLKRLAGLGLLGDYGYYEAMDFSRQTQRQGARGVIVEAYMAHHQGMSFLSLVNYLKGDPFPRRFHADPRMRAFEALLQERIPALPPLQLIPARATEPQLMAADLVASAGSSFTTPHTVTPRSLLLSNGRYGLMVTNSGAGYSQWGGVQLTRWRSDPTLDSGGVFCYIHEPACDRLWSSTFHPVDAESPEYHVEFTLDRAVFRRLDDGIHTETEIIVSPEDDVEVRRITLANRSARPRRLELTSYVELSMAPHNADRQHPAFNKLFIETEALPGQQALLARRRARSDAEAPLHVAHTLTVEEDGTAPAPDQAFRFETDRGHFIGRGRTLANPMGAVGALGNSQGYVLDPMLGVRRSITLEPGQRVRVSLVLAAGESRDEVLLLLNKYSDPHATKRALDFAWRAAQQQLQQLRIQPDEARRFQQLASHLLFPNRALRAAGERLAENHKGQAGLWPYAISGDLPIVLVLVGEAREVSLVRQMLQAHTYWRMHGLCADLVILNEEAASYQRPLQERLEQLIQTHALTALSDQPGSIFLKSAAQIPDEDLQLLKAAASIVLIAARGTLPQQLGAPLEVLESLQPTPRREVVRDPSTELPFMELDYFNSLGGFTPDGREYAIYLGPGTNTPAPWVNVMANPDFGTMVSETGSGFTWQGNSQRNRLTGWSNDPVLDPPTEALYLRDEETGAFWSPTAAPIREATAYRARHGAGYSVFEHNSHGIEQELTVFVPVDDAGGRPVKLQRLRLTNATSRRRRLSLTYYVELVLGESRESSQMHVVTTWDEEAGALLARNRYHPEYPERVAFMALTPQSSQYGGDRASFIGRNRSLADPLAMESVGLSGRVGAGLDPCGALRVTLELAPGERRDLTCLLGEAGSAREARELVHCFREDLALERALEGTKAWWDRLLGTVEVRTPERATDLLVNRWLQYQSLSCRIWGRSAFYQSGGAFGFRDQLQDVTAFLNSRPELARAQILLAASRQFKEGDVQHWWHEPAGAGIRSRISDDLLWLPYVVAQYVRSTGDLEVLREEIPFLNAPPLTEMQHEVFSTPEVTFERASLFEHCRRALAKGLTVGPHGLPLMGTGDWNDGMNLVGAAGKGESVWLAWFLCDCLEGMAEMADLLGETESGRGYREERYALVQRTETAGWDGEWYLRGTFDDGSLLGAAGNREARIDSLPQSWGILSGAADPGRARQALESAWRHLVSEEEGLVLLFEPPFDRADPSPGYIKGYPPGVRENGGQYTHAALWLAMALARQGEGDRAATLLRILNPIEHARDAASAWLYGVEPYVVAADVYRLPGRVGQGGWSWYTGSAAWMYRAWVEEVLGLKVECDRLRVDPVIPAEWQGFSMRYRHGEAVYVIQVENPDGCQRGVVRVELDGRPMGDGVVPLERALVEHRVVVRMGGPILPVVHDQR